MTTAELGGNGDQRVTNAMLLYRMNELEKLLKQWHDDDCRQHEELSRRVMNIEQGAAVRETRLSSVEIRVNDHDEKIDGLKSSDRKWWGASVIVAAIMTSLGALFGGK